MSNSGCHLHSDRADWGLHHKSSTLKFKSLLATPYDTIPYDTIREQTYRHSIFKPLPLHRFAWPPEWSIVWWIQNCCTSIWSMTCIWHISIPVTTLSIPTSFRAGLPCGSRYTLILSKFGTSSTNIDTKPDRVEICMNQMFVLIYQNESALRNLGKYPARRCHDDRAIWNSSLTESGFFSRIDCICLFFLLISGKPAGYKYCYPSWGALFRYWSSEHTATACFHHTWIPRFDEY